MGAPSRDPSPAPPFVKPCAVQFFNTEFLSHPTTASMTVSLIPAEPAELYVEYGVSPGDYTFSTSPQLFSTEQPAVFVLNNLKPNSEYYYRVRCRSPQTQSGTGFGARAEYSFKTLRTLERNQFELQENHPTVILAYLTDSHIYGAWAKYICDAGSQNPLLHLKQNLVNIQGAGVDFQIIGGDYAMTHCNDCVLCSVNGESTGQKTVQSLRQAELRYQITRNQYEATGHSIPSVLVKGNHEGETPFAGSCQHFSTTMEYSFGGRQKYIPLPGIVDASHYNGNPEGSYFTWTSGDAQFWVLDVMRYTPEFPATPADWTLGEEQLAWLESTLAASTKKWKFIFAEHLVGGTPHKNACAWNLDYSYGRGSLKATYNNDINGTFRGEQATIHQMMKEHRAQFFISGHDHVFAFGEKLDLNNNPEGIYYLVGGRAAGHTGPGWADENWFKEIYDYDNDGVTDFIKAAGFIKFTVNGQDSVLIQYIKADALDEAENGKVLFEKIITTP